MARWFSLGGGLEATQRLRHDVMGAMTLNPARQMERGETYLNFSDVTSLMPPNSFPIPIVTISTRHLNSEYLNMSSYGGRMAMVKVSVKCRRVLAGTR